MKYEKPVVRKIIFNNDDILTASTHRCPGWPGSYGCYENGKLCFSVDSILDAGCTDDNNSSRCTLSIGANSIDPAESI